jgi:hypothetical protein
LDFFFAMQHDASCLLYSPPRIDSARSRSGLFFAFLHARVRAARHSGFGVGFRSFRLDNNIYILL